MARMFPSSLPTPSEFVGPGYSRLVRHGHQGTKVLTENEAQCRESFAAKGNLLFLSTESVKIIPQSTKKSLIP